MKKKFFAMYALAGALVASPVFTSCVDDSVSDSVEALRDANVKYKNALTAQTEAQTAINQAKSANDQAMAALEQEAQRLENEATAVDNAYWAAVREYELAEKEYQASLREYNQALKEKKDAIELERLQAEVEKMKAEAEQSLANAERTKANAESKKLENEKTKATLELAILEAKLKAEATNAQEQANLLIAQKNLEKVIKGLELKEQALAEQLSKNANAIMNGGTANFEATNTWDGTAVTKTYLSTYTKDGVNSIMALNNGFVAQKMNLLKLENGLVTIDAWIADEVKKYEEQNEAQAALIAKYEALQKEGSNREDLQKEYDEANLNVATIDKQISELGGNLYKANEALTKHGLAMREDAIMKIINEGYMTPKEAEEYKDTITMADGITTRELTYTFTKVYEHTAKNAEDLAKAIENKNKQIDGYKKEIAEVEAELAKLNGTNWERTATLAKAKADEAQKKYDEIIASEAYKTYIAGLEKAVTDAQAAFDKEPTSGKKKLDENNNPVIDKKGRDIYLSTKEILEYAEEDLRDADVYYQIEGAATTDNASDDKYLSQLENELKKNTLGTGYYWSELKKNQYGEPLNNNGNVAYKRDEFGNKVEEGYWDYDDDGNRFWVMTVYEYDPDLFDYYTYEDVAEGLVGVAEFWANKVKEENNAYEGSLKDLNDYLEDANEDLEALQEIQAAVAEGSEAMTAYLALCEERAELEKAKFELQSQETLLMGDKIYWTNLMNALDDYVGNGTTTGSLPDWADLIAQAEKTIASNKNSIAEITGNTGANVTAGGSTNYSKITIEEAIALKKAELANMEAEMKVRQAEYDAAMEELNALVEKAE